MYEKKICLWRRSVHVWLYKWLHNCMCDYGLWICVWGREQGERERENMKEEMRNERVIKNAFNYKLMETSLASDLHIISSHYAKQWDV